MTSTIPLLSLESAAMLCREEEEEFITSGNWRGKHKSLLNKLQPCSGGTISILDPLARDLQAAAGSESYYDRILL